MGNSGNDRLQVIETLIESGVEIYPLKRRLNAARRRVLYLSNISSFTKISPRSYLADYTYICAGRRRQGAE